MAAKHFMTGSSSNSSSHYAGGYDDQKSKVGSSSNPLHNYEVFLSFSGDDTRHGFADHLYHKLINNGIRVFRDKESLHKGQKIDQLLEAITASKILVPIISTHYASSKWCLKELVQIVKCNKAPAQSVLPIFYKVKPSDVREQKGQFGEKFRLFKENHSDDIELVQESKQAFKEIATLIGWDSNKSHDGYEVPLVNEVVRIIFNKLREPILDVSECLVGVKEHVEEVKKKIYAEQSNEAKIIAIHGMGGIGKTTLAKALYNELFFCDFDCCSFVPNIRERSSTYEGTMDMQKRLISDLLVDKSLQEISHFDEGINTIKRSYNGKNVLLLLDDIDDKDQLKKLAVKNNCLGSKSIVIITTRDEVVTKASGVNLSYQLNELGENQSYELLCKHAFGGDAFCPSNLEDIARNIASKVGGLPLAIEVIGSLLYQENEAFWRTMLQKLERIPIGEVMDRLMLSYEALDRNEKEIFLDIACLPIRYRSKYARYMWDACYFYPKVGIQRLISKSLIKIKDDKIVMHDQLSDLGREIVRREGRYNIGLYSRLWLQEEAIEVMERKQGTANIQALQVGFLGDEIHFTSQQFEGMENLRFLHMEEVYLTGDFENLFSNIIWLQWMGRCSCIDTMEINFNPRKLVILQLWRANITEHWKGWNQVKKLKVLILRLCNNISASPDFSIVEGLEELVLNNCDVLEKIHPSIGKFRKTLKILDVMGCHKLEELPITVLCGLTSLSFNGDSMEILPDISTLTNLKHLRYKDVFERRNRALNLRKLNQLETLEILHSGLLSKWSSGTKLDEASEDINLLLELPLGLEELKVCGCQTLRTFPNLSNLKNLSQLTLTDCSELNHLELEGAESLTNLCIERCKKLSTLSGVGTMVTDLKLESLGALQSLPNLSASKKLKNLNTGGCSNLLEIQGLEDVEALKTLRIKNCRSLEGIANLSHLKMLTTLKLCDCEKLSNVQGLERLASLTKLCLSDPLLDSLDLSTFKKLKNLEISGCSNLVEIQRLEDVEDLETLRIIKCRSLERITNLSQLKMLTTLVLWDCEKLSNVQGLERLASLTKLYLFDPLLDLLDLSAFKKLKNLEIYGCSNLVDIHGLEDVEDLETLRIKKCHSLERIANLSQLKMLTALVLWDCEKLSNVQGLERLTSLIELHISNPLLDSLDLSVFKKLKNLKFSRCSNLVEIQGLEDVEALETLRIKNCRSLERIANLSHLKILTTLVLWDCEKLSNVQGLERLTSLTKLYLSDPLLDSLDLSAFKKLKNLEISGCSNLVEIQGLEDVEALETLRIKNCRSFERIANLSHLKMLATLELCDCEKLGNVKCIERLISLTKLCISEPLLDSLDLSALKKLKNFEISRCSNLVEIQGLQNAEALETLRIKSCHSLERIANLSHLKMLTTLELCDCEKLGNVQGMERLTSLIEICISEPLLDSLDLSAFNKLKKLEISECCNLVEIQGLEVVEALETLRIKKCCSLERITNLSHLKMLTTLELCDCEKLGNVQGMERLMSLTDLCIYEALLDSLDLSTFKKLKNLEIYECSNLVEIQGLEYVEALQSLRIKKCRSLKSITNLSHLKMLTSLELFDCEKLSKVQGVERLTSLIELCISEPSLDSLDLSTFKKLKKLEISGCGNLVEIQGLEDVEALKTLRIKKCSSLERIANLSHLDMLTTLELCDCEKLGNIQGMERLTSLTELCIFEALLDSLDLFAFKKLKNLEICGCSNLVEIQGLEHVEALETLRIKKCLSLERITNLSHLKMLTTLELCDCDKLLLDPQDLSQLTSLRCPLIFPKLLPFMEGVESQGDPKDKKGCESNSDGLEEGLKSQSDQLDKGGSESNLDELEERKESQSDPEDKEGIRSNLDEFEWNLLLF